MDTGQTAERARETFGLPHGMRYVLERGVDDVAFWAKYWMGMELHPGQIEWVGKRARRAYKASGRQSGKTTGEMVAVCYDLFHGGPGYEAMNTAITADQARIIADAIETRGRDCRFGSLVEDYRRAPFPTVKIHGGKRLTCRSLQNKGKYIRGFTYHRVNVDEFAYVSEEEVGAVLEPTVFVRRGSLSGIGTPKGKNHFWTRYMMAKERMDRDVNRLIFRGLDTLTAKRFARYYAAQAPSTESPFMPVEEIEEAREMLPEALFAQEIQAEFIDAGDTLFTHEQVKAVTDRDMNRHQTDDGRWEGVEAKPAEGSNYLWAWDLGRKQSWVAGVLLDYSKTPYRVVDLERHHQKPWDWVVDRIGALRQKWGAKVMIDTTGVGDVVDAWLRKEGGLKAAGYLFNAKSKTELLLSLQKAVQTTSVTMPFFRSLYDQMLFYTWSEKSDYDSTWDDLMALAMAVWYGNYLTKRANVRLEVL